MWSLQSTVTFQDYRARWDLPVTEILRRGMQTSWLPAWLHVHQERRLPLVPFWPGFAANTLVYLLVVVGIQLLVIRVFEWASGRAATTAPAQSGQPVVLRTEQHIDTNTTGCSAKDTISVELEVCGLSMVAE